MRCLGTTQLGYKTVWVKGGGLVVAKGLGLRKGCLWFLLRGPVGHLLAGAIREDPLSAVVLHW